MTCKLLILRSLIAQFITTTVYDILRISGIRGISLENLNL